MMVSIDQGLFFGLIVFTHWSHKIAIVNESQVAFLKLHEVIPSPCLDLFLRHLRSDVDDEGETEPDDVIVDGVSHECHWLLVKR